MAKSGILFFESGKSKTTYRLTRVNRYVVNIAFICSVILIGSKCFSQIPQEIVLHDTIAGKVHCYLGIGCSDKNNCTIVGYYFEPNSFPHYVPDIRRTTDGGITWAGQSIQLSNRQFYDAQLTHVTAIDSSNVFIYGDSGLAFRTMDAGETWKKQDMQTVLPIRDASFIDPANGMIVAPGRLVERTTDSGNSWQKVANIPSVDNSSCGMFDAERSSIFQYGFGPVFTTANGWISSDSGMHVGFSDSAEFAVVTKVLFLDSLHLRGMGAHRTRENIGNSQNTYLVNSDDGGQHWQTTYDDFNPRIVFGPSDIAMDRNNNGGGVVIGPGNSGILWTSDSGGHWNSDTLTDGGSFHDIIGVVNVDKDDYFLLSVLDAGLKTQGQVTKIHLPNSSHVEGFEQVRIGTHIYPNPANTSFTIFANTGMDALYEVYDVLGRVVERSFVGNAHHWIVNSRSMPAGSYRLIAQVNGFRIQVANIMVIH